jgi:hypothetical protein
MSDHQPSWPWTVAVAIVSVAYGASWLWSAWSIMPPARDRLSAFQVSSRDFWIDEQRPRRGAMRIFSGLRLDVSAPDGVLRLRVPANIPIFIDAEAKAAPITVLVNTRSQTMLEIAGGGAVHLAYDEAAKHARWQAQKEALLGFAIVGLGGLPYWRARRRRGSLSR